MSHGLWDFGRACCGNYSEHVVDNACQDWRREANPVVLQHTKRTIRMNLAGSVNLESRSGNARPEHRHPLVSMVTIARYSASTIANAIESVLSQDYRPLEYIVIDGASTDGTVEIVGIYSAMLVDRSAYDRVGAFDTSFRFAADNDWAVRALIVISAICLWLVSLLTSGCSGLVYCWQYFPIGNAVYFKTRRKPAEPARNSIDPISVG
jgi:hypothetical protein